MRKNNGHFSRLKGSITERVESFFNGLCKKGVGHLGVVPSLSIKVLTEYDDHEVRQGEGHEVVVHGRVEVGAPKDDHADRDVAEDPRDEDRGVEEGDDHQGQVVVHLHRPQHHLQVVRHLRPVVRGCHLTRLRARHCANFR